LEEVYVKFQNSLQQLATVVPEEDYEQEYAVEETESLKIDISQPEQYFCSVSRN